MLIHQERRLMNSGTKTTKRSVSETKKKYVASQQSWKYGDCSQPLSAWFEVDHKTRLEHGGSNHIDNFSHYVENVMEKKRLWKICKCKYYKNTII